MGIAGYHKWLAKTFGSAGAVVNVKETDAPRAYDHIFFDLNGIAHKVARNSRSEEAFFVKFYANVDRVLRSVRPTATVWFVLDGPGPLAKVNTQRARRGKKQSGKAAERELVVDPLMLTPGTHFMLRLENALEYYICQRVQGGKYRNVRFFISSARRAGEGELKIVECINELARTRPKGEKYLIVGMDADLILLGLSTRLSSGMSVLAADPQAKGQPFTILYDLDRMQAAFEHHVPGAGDSVRADFVLMAILCGNDYLPKLRGYSLNPAWRGYLNARRSKKIGPIVTGDPDSPRLEPQALAAFLSSIRGFVPDDDEAAPVPLTGPEAAGAGGGAPLVPLAAAGGEGPTEEGEEDEAIAPLEVDEEEEEAELEEDEEEDEDEDEEDEEHEAPAAAAAAPAAGHAARSSSSRHNCELYLRGLLWNLEMYGTGRCHEPLYVYPGGAPPARVLAEWVGSEPERTAALSPARTGLEPLPSAPHLFALYLLPPRGAPFVLSPLRDLLPRYHQSLDEAFAAMKRTKSSAAIVEVLRRLHAEADGLTPGAFAACPDAAPFGERAALPAPLTAFHFDPRPPPLQRPLLPSQKCRPFREPFLIAALPCEEPGGTGPPRLDWLARGLPRSQGPPGPPRASPTGVAPAPQRQPAGPGGAAASSPLARRGAAACTGSPARGPRQAGVGVRPGRPPAGAGASPRRRRRRCCRLRGPHAGPLGAGAGAGPGADLTWQQQAMLQQPRARRSPPPAAAVPPPAPAPAASAAAAAAPPGPGLAPSPPRAPRRTRAGPGQQQQQAPRPPAPSAHALDGPALLPTPPAAPAAGANAARQQQRPASGRRGGAEGAPPGPSLRRTRGRPLGLRRGASGRRGGPRTRRRHGGGPGPASALNWQQQMLMGFGGGGGGGGGAGGRRGGGRGGRGGRGGPVRQ
eukprot:tig00001493_g8979.t1